jgi:hypothetical protein
MFRSTISSQSTTLTKIPLTKTASLFMDNVYFGESDNEKQFQLQGALLIGWTHGHGKASNAEGAN